MSLVARPVVLQRSICTLQRIAGSKERICHRLQSRFSEDQLELSSLGDCHS